ncbi:von Willebrand factor A domain-containing protein 7-like, partial [Clarias magur]
DFYSHSNWIEMGKTEPYSKLIKPDTLINNLADSETCSRCESGLCQGNILDEVIAQQKLTSGYFVFEVWKSKPPGKCSHGGKFDQSSWGQGGINKDELTSSHGYLHEAAASVATAATKELLQDIRATVGDSEFLRLMGLRQTSVMCFVIDTTASMSDDIAEVRRITSSIINRKTVTAAEPSEYILVPFNDPGISQSSAELNGALGLIENIGNFYTVQPNISIQTGLWVFSIDSTQPYTIRVVGESKIDFIFDFVELSQGAHPSYAVLNSRPAANTNLTLLVSMIGGDSVTPTAVSLVEASSTNSFNGTLEEGGSGQYLVTFSSTPAGEFTVRVTGQISSSKTSDNTFQRQTPTQFQTSSVTVITQPVGTVEPGKQFTLPFTVSTTGSGGSFKISVSNDRSFDSLFNASLTLDSGGSANATVALTVPANTSSGTDVTVTIQAEAPDGSDSNYAVLRLAVIAP